MPAPLLIRNSASGKIFPAIGPLVGAAIFGFLTLKGLALGTRAARSSCWRW